MEWTCSGYGSLPTREITDGAVKEDSAVRTCEGGEWSSEATTCRSGFR